MVFLLMLGGQIGLGKPIIKEYWYKEELLIDAEKSYILVAHDPDDVHPVRAGKL